MDTTALFRRVHTAKNSDEVDTASDMEYMEVLVKKVKRNGTHGGSKGPTLGCCAP
jgi:hypothetical protein